MERRRELSHPSHNGAVLHAKNRVDVERNSLFRSSDDHLVSVELRSNDTHEGDGIISFDGEIDWRRWREILEEIVRRAMSPEPNAKPTHHFVLRLRPSK